MTLLPIVVRELRVAARQPKTYWARAGGAGAFVLLAGWIYWETRHLPFGNAHPLFQVLAWVAWGGCFLAGPIYTADCLSREKRESTLGLLFLTDLKGYDVVLGKLLSHSLSTALGIVGLFPVLAVPILIGGVSYAEFGRVILSLLVMLFFSLAAGLSVSVFGRDMYRTSALNFLIVLFFAALLPAFGELAEDYYKLPRVAEWLRLFSPGFVQEMALAPFLGTRAPMFWMALVCTTATGIVFLGVACLLAPRSWQEKPAHARPFFLKSWLQRCQQWNLGQTPTGRAFRTWALERNPFFWLAGRERIVSMGFFTLALMMVSAAMWICWRYMVKSRGGPMESGEAMLFVWACVTVGTHVFLLAKIAVAASRRFGEDRHSGALELILGTPMSVGRILRGQWLALLRGCGGPILIALFFHGVFLWAFAHQMRLDRGSNLGPWSFAMDALGRAWSGADGPEEVVVILSLICAAVLIFVLYWVALGWVGMWLGLRLRQTRNAPWLALALVVGPPWPVFGLLVYAFSYVEFLWSHLGFFGFCLKMLLVIQLIHNSLLSFWAWRKLRKEFRTVATSRFQATLWTWPAFLRWRMLVRFAAGVGAACLLVAGFYSVERWRGTRAWEKVRREAETRGENLQWASLFPSPIHDADNLAKTRVFENLSPSSPWLNGYLRPLPLLGSVDAFADWTRQRKTDFAKWQKHFQARPPKTPAGGSPPDPVSYVLESLVPFEQELRELESASLRPQAWFLSGNATNNPLGLVHWNVLQSLNAFLNLRAAARLSQTNAADALRDVQLALRLTEAVRSEPWLRGHGVCLEMLNRSIPTIWEGFADRRWTPEQALALQHTLANFNLVADFDRTTRGEMLWQIEQWEVLLQASGQITPPRFWYRGSEAWLIFSALYPEGWARQNQAQLYQFYRQHLRGLVDSTNGQIRLAENLAALELTKAAPARLNDFRGRAPLFHSYIVNLARAQSAVNLALTACALERFRGEHGAYPDQLEALLPAYLEKLPRDPLTGGALRYSRAEEGRYVLLTARSDGQNNLTVPGNWVWRYPSGNPQ